MHLYMAGPLRAFVERLPRESLPTLKGLLEERLCREQLAAQAPPAPAPASDLLSTKAAAAALGCSGDEIRERVRRGELVAVRGKTGSRLHFEPAALAAYITGHR